MHSKRRQRKRAGTNGAKTLPELTEEEKLGMELALHEMATQGTPYESIAELLGGSDLAMHKHVYRWWLAHEVAIRRDPLDYADAHGFLGRRER